jgi:predicted ATP-dependent serine protease
MAEDAEPVPTGWKPLDRQLRNGGLPPGNLLLIGGTPFAGKTTLACQILLEMSRQMPVFGLFADEGRSRAATRIGVQAGIPLKEIEASPRAAGEAIDALLAERSIHLLKPERAGVCAEAIVTYARQAVPVGSPALIVLDSIQTVPLRAEEGPGRPTEKRHAITALVAACRVWAERYRWPFLLVSKANRAFYRSRKEEDNATAMTAFSEAAVEYLADVAIVLGLTDAKTKIVKVAFVKNRLVGTTDPFTVRYSKDTGRMDEIDDATADQESAAAELAKLIPVKDAVKKLLRKQGDCSVGQVREALRGKTGYNAVLEAIGDLEKTGQVTRAKREGRGGGWNLHLETS